MGSKAMATYELDPNGQRRHSLLVRQRVRPARRAVRPHRRARALVAALRTRGRPHARAPQAARRVRGRGGWTVVRVRRLQRWCSPWAAVAKACWITAGLLPTPRARHGGWLLLIPGTTLAGRGSRPRAAGGLHRLDRARSVGPDCECFGRLAEDAGPAGAGCCANSVLLLAGWRGSTQRPCDVAGQFLFKAVHSLLTWRCTLFLAFSCRKPFTVNSYPPPPRKVLTVD